VADTSNVSRRNEKHRTGRRELRRSVGVTLGILMFMSLSVSPSRAFCESYTLDFANVPAEDRVEAGPGSMISIVGELWRTDCASDSIDPSGGGCSGPVERPLKNISVELVGKAGRVVVAQGISAQGEYETWVLNFRVPQLAEGIYRIHAYDDDAPLAATNDRLSLRISRDGPRGGPAAT
jgi:hypothetical protein